MRRGKARRTLAAVVACGALLLGAQAAEAAIIVPVYTLGRKVVEVKTASARWTASAQGEYVDDNYVTKPDPNALRGRGAVKEISGVQRIRIHDVTLQQRQADGTWKNIVARTQDVVDERPTAYAVAYTPTVKTCWVDDRVKTYRVISNYGVRQSSGTATNRSLTSLTFLGPRLASDPTCPPGAFNAWLAGGPSETYVGDTYDVYFMSNWVGLSNQPTPDPVVVTVDFDDSLSVELVVPDGLHEIEDQSDPDDVNDYGLVADEWPSAGFDYLEARFAVTPTQAGIATSVARVSTATPNVEDATDTWVTTVLPVE